MHRSKAIDILRALAVFLVLGRHMEEPSAQVGASLFDKITHGFAATWQCGGWMGVDLFFVLSGFLVSGLLFREHQKFGALSAKNFLIRRGLKIYPSFWLMIGITTVAALLLHNFKGMKPLLSELLFVQNYGPAIWNHTWSLAVEEHFYVLLLLFLVVLSQRKSENPFRIVPATFVVVAVVSLELRIATAYAGEFHAKTHLFPSHLRMDSLFFGVLISYCYNYHAVRFFELARRYRILALLLGVLLLTPAFYIPLGTQGTATFGITFFYLGSGLILSAALTFNLGKSKFATAASYFGSRSYSVYLWHIPFKFWVLPRMEKLLGGHWNWNISFVLYLFGSIAVGIVMALIVEFPVLKVRDRWFPSRSRPLPASGETAPTLAIP